MTARPRRARGEGSIVEYDTKAGRRYYIKATVPDGTGTPRQRVKRGFLTQKEAARALRELIRSGEQAGGYVPPTKQTLGEYLDEWLDGIRVAPSTEASYRKNVRVHIKPRIGSITLAQLSTSKIDAFYRDLEREGRADGTGGLSARTVRYVHTILRKALADAIKDAGRGLLTNPTDNARPPTAKAAKAPEMMWWSPEDAQQFLTWAEDNVADEYVVAWKVALATGIRRGELLGLRWKDVDLDNRTIAVARSVTTVKTKGEKQRLVEGPTKSGRTRVVDIDEQTANRLRWFRVYRAGNLAIKLVNPDMVVFGDEEGSWRLPESFSRTFRQQLARFRRTQPVNQQIPAIHFHSLRHTHAVWLLKAGVHPKVVQERLGHETIGITMDIYSHVMPSMGREAAAQLGSMLYSK